MNTTGTGIMAALRNEPVSVTARETHLDTLVWTTPAGDSLVVSASVQGGVLAALMRPSDGALLDRKRLRSLSGVVRFVRKYVPDAAVA